MSMKNALLPACLLLLGLAACNKSSAAEKVIGNYELDKAATVTANVEMAKKQDPKTDVANATKDAETMLGMLNMSMDVKADGTLVFRMTGTEENGTWKHEGDTITVTTKKAGKDEVRKGTIDGDKIRFTITEGPKPMTFVLEKKK